MWNDPCFVNWHSKEEKRSVHWPLLARCGSQCQSGPSRVQQPPRCHTAHQSSVPQRSPWQSLHLFAHTERYFIDRPRGLNAVTCACMRACVRAVVCLCDCTWRPSPEFIILFIAPSCSGSPAPPYSASLSPICWLNMLPLPITATPHTSHPLPPTHHHHHLHHSSSPSRPTILHTEDKYRSAPEGEVSECFVRDTTWLVSTSDCQCTSEGELAECNLTFIRAASFSLSADGGWKKPPPPCSAFRAKTASRHPPPSLSPVFFASSDADATLPLMRIN